MSLFAFGVLFVVMSTDKALQWNEFYKMSNISNINADLLILILSGGVPPSTISAVKASNYEGAWINSNYDHRA